MDRENLGPLENLNFAQAATDPAVIRLSNSSELFEEDILDIWNYEHSVEQYVSEGGTSKASVVKQIVMLDKWLQASYQ